MKHSLKTLWNAQVAPVSLSYKLSRAGGRLFFSVDFPEEVTGQPLEREGEFIEELWTWDVAEFFISGDEGTYLECNLSPKGAFWVQGFTGVRMVDSCFQYERLDCQATRGLFSCSLTALETYLGPSERWKYNVTGILNSPNHVYLSKVKLPGERPDFHQPLYFSGIDF